jgi:hypothetical protein
VQPLKLCTGESRLVSSFPRSPLVHQCGVMLPKGENPTAMSIVDRLRRESDPLSAQIGKLVDRLQHHPVWERLRSIEEVRSFMEHHVWAVWDFMSLLKSLQAELAPTRVPWVPPGDADSARFINEIVVGEESDQGPDGRPASHFEIYLEAMKAAGARTDPITSFLMTLTHGEPYHQVIERLSLPSGVHEFVRATFEFCRASLPERVAAFTMGREEIIPSMFGAALRGLPERGKLEGFIWYLQRHVVIDGDRHGPLAARLFEKICLTEPSRSVALKAARRALELRLALWDGVIADLG